MAFSDDDEVHDGSAAFVPQEKKEGTFNGEMLEKTGFFSLVIEPENFNVPAESSVL